MPLLATRLSPARYAWGLLAPQYPGEKEITFPPYTCLESDGDARLERDAQGNEVIIFPLKVCQTGIGCCSGEGKSSASTPD
jgi:hypothetical protein